MKTPTFVNVEVVPCAAAEDGRQLRFKRSDGGAIREIEEVSYESEDGTAGVWHVRAINAEDDEGGAPTAYHVEDSSDGTVWLIVGGSYGLRLVHAATGSVAREPYLVMSLRTELK